jgi:hypothetical protein
MDAHILKVWWELLTPPSYSDSRTGQRLCAQVRLAGCGSLVRQVRIWQLQRVYLLCYALQYTHSFLKAKRKSDLPRDQRSFGNFWRKDQSSLAKEMLSQKILVLNK